MSDFAQSRSRHDRKDREIEITPKEAKQGTGPRSMLLVLVASLALAAGAGLVFTFYA